MVHQNEIDTATTHIFTYESSAQGKLLESRRYQKILYDAVEKLEKYEKLHSSTANSVLFLRWFEIGWTSEIKRESEWKKNEKEMERDWQTVVWIAAIAASTGGEAAAPCCYCRTQLSLVELLLNKYWIFHIVEVLLTYSYCHCCRCYLRFHSHSFTHLLFIQ